MTSYMDDETAKQRVDALLATAGEITDVAEFFIAYHPTPEEIHAVHDAASHREVAMRTRTLVEALRVLFVRGVTHYKDRNFSIVWRGVINDPSYKTDMRIYERVRDCLVAMALNLHRFLDQTQWLSQKTKLLRFFLWIARGRKDEDIPIELRSHEPRQIDEAREHKYLPTSGIKKGVCSVCSKTESMYTCERCTVDVDKEYQSHTRFFCGFECHGVSQHGANESCREIMALDRATKAFVGLYQEVHLQFYCCDLVEVVDNGPILLARYGGMDERVFRGASFFREFPSQLAGGIVDQRMIIMSTESHSLVRNAELLFEMFIRPVAALIEEVAIQPKNMHKVVLSVDPEAVSCNAVTRHRLFRITLPSGKQFAFDPTAVQFGWRETLSPWESFLEHRAHNGVREMAVIEPMADGKAKRTALRASQFSPNLPWNTDFEDVAIRARDRFIESTCAAFEGLVREAMNSSDDEAIPKLLTTRNKDNFIYVLTELLYSTRYFLQTMRYGMDRTGTYKLYLDFNRQLHLTTEEETSQRLQKVWLSEEEYKSAKSLEEIERLYLGRLYRGFWGER